jgi:hypothetical protein
MFMCRDSNVTDVAVTVPHTVTEWLGSGFCVNAKSGVGVSKPFKITAFQPFFMSFTLPYSLVRGESVAIPVTVFNYLTNQCLKVRATCHCAVQPNIGRFSLSPGSAVACCCFLSDGFEGYAV